MAAEQYLFVPDSYHSNLVEYWSRPPAPHSAYLNQVRFETPWDAFAEGFRLMDSPYELTYISGMSKKEMDRISKDIYRGELVKHVDQPSLPTKQLLQFLGSGDEDGLIISTKQVVDSIFQPIPAAGEVVKTAMDIMRQVHGGRMRKTGERVITHEIRILNMFLSDTLFHRQSIQARGFTDEAVTDFLATNNLWTLATCLTALIFHDLKEDYINKGKAKLFVDPHDHSQLIITLPSGENRSIRFPQSMKRSTGKVIELVDTFTQDEYRTGSTSTAASTEEYTSKILHSLRPFTSALNWLYDWIIYGGKSADREDNISRLWTHTLVKYREKLKETLEHYQKISFLAWDKRHELDRQTPLSAPVPADQSIALQQETIDIPDVPRGLSTAVLKALGLNDDDLYGWITNSQNPGGKVIQEISQKAKTEGCNIVIIPTPTQAEILVTNGNSLDVYQVRRRNPDFTKFSLKRFSSN